MPQIQHLSHSHISGTYIMYYNIIMLIHDNENTVLFFIFLIEINQKINIHKNIS